MSNTEYRTVINFFIQKGLGTTEIAKALTDVSGHSALSYRTVMKLVAEFNNPTRTFEDPLRSVRPTTTLINLSIRAVEEIATYDQQISVRHVADKLDISKTSVDEIISDYLGMKKICTRWVLKLFTLVQRANQVNCCEELLENCNQDPSGFSGRIVTKGETWIHYYDSLSQQEAKIWKKPNEKTPTRPRVTPSAIKIIVTIFWHCQGVLLVDFLPRGTTIDDPYYASLLHQVCSFIQEKRLEKLRHGVLRLLNNTPVYKSNITQSAIQYTGFTELNHPGYTPDLAPSDYHLF